MARKRLTQLFPWLIPLRTKQRRFCFYLEMRLDGRRYAALKSEEQLVFPLFTSHCPLYNRETGWDMKYQENKVHNLKLAAAAVDGLLIRPGETFSFCKAVRHADRFIPYRDGLTVVNGALTAAPGGGLCQLSNLLFWLFLHSPLTIVVRHGHAVIEFPEPSSDAPVGVDATISEGWLDLKVKNDTEETFQIRIAFDPENITGRLLTEHERGFAYRVFNGRVDYYRRDGLVYEEAEVMRERIPVREGVPAGPRLLYRNLCRIDYPLPSGTPIVEKGESK